MCRITQLSVFIENKKGRFAHVVKLLGEGEVNIRAMSLADTVDFGILRFVVNKPDVAYSILKENGLVVRKDEVLAMEVEDRPGGLAELLQSITEQDLNVEYMYTFNNVLSKKAVMIFRFEDTVEAIGKLEKAGVKLLPSDYFWRI
ncbi:MAG: amino acid-binding protein [Deltaproteobacteria bacterium]|nr:amino acid-binding protein [Deltaproteobacteria bacterium]